MVLFGLRDNELPEPGEGDDSDGYAEKTESMAEGRPFLWMGIAYAINMGTRVRPLIL